MKNIHSARLSVVLPTQVINTFDHWVAQELGKNSSDGWRYVLTKQVILFFREHEYGDNLYITQDGYDKYLRYMEDINWDQLTYKNIRIPEVVMRFIKERASINAMKLNAYVMRILIREMANS